MDQFKYLVLKFSSNTGKWYDATNDIECIKNAGSSYLIKFKNKNNYIHVSFINIHLYSNPKTIDFFAIENKGVPLYKVSKCLLFDNKYKLFFENGYTLVADFEDILILKDDLKENPKAKGILNYYKNVVQLTAQSEEDTFMISQFDDIKSINDKSVLASFLKGENGRNCSPLNKAIISPFGTNLTQLQAVNMAFKNKISIIEGPPGTGKTQTILNIIANAIAKGYSVAVVSNNNSAIENIYYKLERNNFSFICALLGNKENTENFFEHLDTTVPNLTTNEATNSERIGALNYLLPDLFEKENQKNKLIETKESIEFEYKHFLDQHSDFKFDSYSCETRKISKSKLMKIMVYLQENQEKLTFFKKLQIKRQLKCNRQFFKQCIEDQIVVLQNKYYLLYIFEIENKINHLNKELCNKSFSEHLNEYIRLSLTSFKNSLNSIFKERGKISFTKSDYKFFSESFYKNYPVILSSTYSLAQCTKGGYLYDYLIIDEASQVNMASAILSMRVAKNMIVVGDLKQLPQIDERNFCETNKKLLSKYGVNNCYSYHGNSIMSSILSVYGNSLPRVLLKEHYRCDPAIIGFCNKEFYDNELVIYTKNKVDKPLRLIKLVEGNHARRNPNGDGGLYSIREADEILKEVKERKPTDLGIITPYKIQVKTIQDKIGENEGEISTIHKFQGREKKNVILSTVVNSSNEFVDDPNMINVAVSRAIDTFTLIASDKVVKSDNGILSDLVKYIEYHTNYSEVHNSKIQSIFDILYSDYSEKLQEFRKKHPSEEFDSENIVKNLILDVLKSNNLNNLKLAMHVSLKDALESDFIQMTKKEEMFFNNPKSHFDFVIYNKYNNLPFAIIEVDGVAYHEQQHAQMERDALKDSIIQKAGVKFLRLKTNESNERERILQLLRQ